MCKAAPCDKPDCTWSEQHRRECEARHVMAMPREVRMGFYTRVKKIRGEAAAQRLVDEVKRQWGGR